MTNDLQHLFKVVADVHVKDYQHEIQTNTTRCYRNRQFDDFFNFFNVLSNFMGFVKPASVVKYLIFPNRRSQRYLE